MSQDKQQQQANIADIMNMTLNPGSVSQKHEDIEMLETSENMQFDEDDKLNELLNFPSNDSASSSKKRVVAQAPPPALAANLRFGAFPPQQIPMMPANMAAAQMQTLTPQQQQKLKLMQNFAQIKGLAPTQLGSNSAEDKTFQLTSQNGVGVGAQPAGQVQVVDNGTVGLLSSPPSSSTAAPARNQFSAANMTQQLPYPPQMMYAFQAMPQNPQNPQTAAAAATAAMGNPYLQLLQQIGSLYNAALNQAQTTGTNPANLGMPSLPTGAAPLFPMQIPQTLPQNPQMGMPVQQKMPSNKVTAQAPAGMSLMSPQPLLIPSAGVPAGYVPLLPTAMIPLSQQQAANLPKVPTSTASSSQVTPATPTKQNASSSQSAGASSSDMSDVKEEKGDDDKDEDFNVDASPTAVADKQRAAATAKQINEKKVDMRKGQRGGRSGKPRAKTCQRWTEEQNRALREAVSKYGPRNWKKIAEEIGGVFTADQCNQHWHRVLNPRIIKGDWTPQEDDNLFDRVNTYGESSWTKIAEGIPGRTDIQCRHRYFQRKKEIQSAGGTINVSPRKMEGDSPSTPSDATPDATTKRSRKAPKGKQRRTESAFSAGGKAYETATSMTHFSYVEEDQFSDDEGEVLDLKAEEEMDQSPTTAASAAKQQEQVLTPPKIAPAPQAAASTSTAAGETNLASDEEMDELKIEEEEDNEAVADPMKNIIYVRAIVRENPEKPGDIIVRLNSCVPHLDTSALKSLLKKETKETKESQSGVTKIPISINRMRGNFNVSVPWSEAEESVLVKGVESCKARGIEPDFAVILTTNVAYFHPLRTPQSLERRHEQIIKGEPDDAGSVEYVIQDEDDIMGDELAAAARTLTSDLAKEGKPRRRKEKSADAGEGENKKKRKRVKKEKGVSPSKKQKKGAASSAEAQNSDVLFAALDLITMEDDKRQGTEFLMNLSQAGTEGGPTEGDHDMEDDAPPLDDEKDGDFSLAAERSKSRKKKSTKPKQPKKKKAPAANAAPASSSDSTPAAAASSSDPQAPAPTEDDGLNGDEKRTNARWENIRKKLDHVFSEEAEPSSSTAPKRTRKSKNPVEIGDKVHCVLLMDDKEDSRKTGVYELEKKDAEVDLNPKLAIKELQQYIVSKLELRTSVKLEIILEKKVLSPELTLEAICQIYNIHPDDLRLTYRSKRGR